MRALFPAALGVCLTLSVAVAQNDAASGDAGRADAIGSGLSEVLSFATLGMVNTREQPAQVTRSGANYLVRLPLKGFAVPADASVNAVARPEDGGLWDITSMTFPSSGTVDKIMAKGGINRIAYSIGEQSIHGTVDPALAQPSSFAANLGAIVLRSDYAGQHSEQVFERYIMDGTLTAEADGQLDFVTRSSASNWHLTAQGRNGFDTDGLVRKLSGHATFSGLDQAQGARLLVAARALMGATPAEGGPPGLTEAQHADLRALVDSLRGLLAKFEADETLDGISFSAGPSTSGTLGRVHVEMAGNAADDRLDAHSDMAVDDLAVAGLQADAAAYVPRHVDIKSAVSGVPTGRLMALLRDATGQDPDQAALQAELTAVLGDPAVRIGVESVNFDSGPVRVTGSAHVVQRANGQLGADIHISATGMDALFAQAQGKPALQRMLPLMFMARGMGRPDGGATVWDISVGGGELTVNGTPLGQTAARMR